MTFLFNKLLRRILTPFILLYLFPGSFIACNQRPLDVTPESSFGRWVSGKGFARINYDNLSGSSASNIYGTGDWGKLIYYDGSTWSEIYGPGPVPLSGGPQPPPINDVWVTSDNNFYAITNTTVYHYNGTGWIVLYENNQARMKSIWGFSTSNLYIAAGDVILNYNGSGWTVDSLDTVSGVSEIWGSDPSNIFAAGTDERILHNDGMGWTEVYRGSKGLPSGFWGSGPADVYAAYTGRLLYFDGISWTPVSLPEDVRYIRTLWGTGNNNLFLFHGSGNIHYFDGLEWQEMNSQTNMELFSAWGTANDNIYAVGESRKIIHFDGTEWSSVSGGAPAEPSFIWGLDDRNIYIGNLGSVFRYDGSQFEELPTLLDPLETLDMWGTSPTHLVSVGRYGKVFFYDGTTWNRADVPTEDYLYAVSGVAADAIWAVGYSTCIFYNGSRWIKLYENTESGPMFNDVWAASRNDVFLVGWSGVLARFDGAVWTFFEGIAQEHLFGVWGTSASNVYAVGNRIILHFDGNTWRRMPFPGYLDFRTNVFLTVTGSSATDIFTGGYGEYAFHFNGSIWSSFPKSDNAAFSDMWCSPGGKVFAIEYWYPYLHIYQR